MQGHVLEQLEVERLLRTLDVRVRLLEDRVAKLWGDSLAVASWAPASQPPAAPTGTIPIQVYGCASLALPAAGLAEALLYSGGTLVQTQTTDASGVATFTGVAPGTYTITVQGAGAAAGRWASASVGPITFTGGTYTGLNQTLGTPASGYVCWLDCAVPVKTTLAVSDSNGAHAGLLAYSSGTGTFPGCYTKSLASGGALLAHGACSNAAVASPIFLTLGNTGSHLSASTLSVAGFVCDTTNYQPTQGTCSSTANLLASPSPVLLSYQCWPFVLTFGGINFPQAGSSIGSLLSSGTNILITE